MQLQLVSNKKLLPLLFLFITSAALGNRTRLPKDTSTAVQSKVQAIADLSFEQLKAAYEVDPGQQKIRDSARALLDEIARSNTWLDVISADALTTTPFGLKKLSAGTEYQIGFSAITFGSGQATARVFARIILPQRDESGNKKQMFFAGNVNLSRIGGVKPEATLLLVGDEPVKTSDHWSLVLNGTNPTVVRKPEELCKMKFDCTGFKELTISGDVLLSKDFYQPANNAWEPFADPSARVSASFKGVAVTSWSSLFIKKLKFERPFLLKKFPSYCFQIADATLDFTDDKNIEGNEKLDAYITKVQPQEKDTWRGLAISDLIITLPNEYRPRDVKERPLLPVKFGVIDGSGFSTTVKEKDIIPIAKGSAGGWPFSVDTLSLYIERGSLTGGGIAGRLLLPIQDKKKTAGNGGGTNYVYYSGKILGNGGYEIGVGFGDMKIKAPMWKASLNPDKSSSIILRVADGQFRPKVVLSGMLAFNSGGTKNEEVSDAPGQKKKVFNCEGVTFEELTLQTEKPYISVKAMGAKGALNIASFEATYEVEVSTEKPAFIKTQSDVIALNFAAGIKLMEGKIAGATALSIYGVYNEAESQWEYYDTKLGNIAVKADFGKTSFSGDLTIMRDDPVYGDGFAGNMKLKAHRFELDAAAIFGTATTPAAPSKPFRYWSVDGKIKGFNLRTGALTFTGFAGGASYKMNVQDKENTRLPSGVLYVPDNNAFLRVRAGVLFNVYSEKACKATAGFEIVFNNNWGVNEVRISGTAKLLTKDQKGNDDADMKTGLKSLTSSGQQKLPGDGASIWGALLVRLDLQNDVYQGQLDAYVNFDNVLVGGRGDYLAGTATFYISPSKWNISIGTQNVPIAMNINSPIRASGTGYFEIGNNIPAGGSEGFGVKFGYAFWLESRTNIGWLYANVGGGLKFDIMLFRNPNFYCDGRPAGINGWYGSAGLSAWLQANVGVRFWGRDFSVLNASIRADLQIRGPRPIYYYGKVTGSYKVGCCWFCYKRGDFSVDVSGGTYCKF